MLVRVRVFESEEGAARARAALPDGGGYQALGRADISLSELGAAMADLGDDYGLAIALLRACSQGFGARHDEVFEGDLHVELGSARLVVGDLSVSKRLTIEGPLLVTGNVHATTIVDNYSHGYLAVLGNVSARGVCTDGPFYVGQTLSCRDLLVIQRSGYFVGANVVRTPCIYMPDPNRPVTGDVTEVARWIGRESGSLAMQTADLFATGLYSEAGEVDPNQMLAWIDSGRDIFAAPGQPPTPVPLDAIASWLRTDRESSQREKLKTLRDRWVPRLASYDAADVQRVLEATFTSKKRRADLQEILAEIESLREG